MKSSMARATLESLEVIRFRVLSVIALSEHPASTFGSEPSLPVCEMMSAILLNKR